MASMGPSAEKTKGAIAARPIRTTGKSALNILKAADGSSSSGIGAGLDSILDTNGERPRPAINMAGMPTISPY